MASAAAGAAPADAAASRAARTRKTFFMTLLEGKEREYEVAVSAAVPCGRIIRV